MSPRLHISRRMLALVGALLVVLVAMAAVGVATSAGSSLTAAHGSQKAGAQTKPNVYWACVPLGGNPPIGNIRLINPNTTCKSG